MPNNRFALLRTFVLMALAFLILYVILYTTIERARASKGPWKVLFASDGVSAPFLTIEQPGMNIAGMKIVFDGKNSPHTNASHSFDKMREVPFDLPFGTATGTCKFQELNFLPGTVVITVYGHEIQLMPRLLTIDRTQEIAWKQDRIIHLN
jgi:hypothetical protein